MKKYIALMFLTIMTDFAFSQTTPKPIQAGIQVSPVTEATINQVIKILSASSGEKNLARIQKGVTQAASLWRETDGNEQDFAAFCSGNFMPTETGLDTLFIRLQNYFELMFGTYNKLSVSLKETIHLENGTLLPIDEMFGGYEPSAHFTDDFFQNKIAFVVVLNFPFYSLGEKTTLGTNWTRKQWAYARMGDIFTSRVPANLLLKAAETLTAADTYISAYNIYMGNLTDSKGKTWFPKDMKLITHWGLRDELKSNYSDKQNGIIKQKMIYSVMKRIIDQSIPQQIINNDTYLWNPETNTLLQNRKSVPFSPEPDTRYATLLNNFQAMKAIDPYNPNYPDFISRAFDAGLEISQADVEKLFTDFISSPQVKEVGKLISKRLGRNIEPFDIWYDGFKSRSSISAGLLDEKVKNKYPDRNAFEKDLPKILIKLGFSPAKAAYLTSKIQVDPARGSGHAWGAQMKNDKAHLRTRIGNNGMDYKGYNIAIHEFGHNVEQTLSLYDVDYYMLNGVPNTAFTEALAFIFQKRDLELLGINDDNPQKEHLMVLDNFWACYEIMGVSLVDMKVWKWMYQHPDATPAQCKQTVISTAKEIWNLYYAPVFGTYDEPILAIYSHMIDNPLYLSAYPVGHLIDFQIENHIRDKNFASETERIYTQGRLIPQLWMKKAVGSEISIQPLLKAATEALKVVTK